VTSAYQILDKKDTINNVLDMSESDRVGLTQSTDTKKISTADVFVSSSAVSYVLQLKSAYTVEIYERGTENAGVENAIRAELQGRKIQEWKKHCRSR